jgi:hypothetical protein
LHPNIGTEHGTPNGILNGGVREKTEGAEVVCNPIGKTISTIQFPPEFLGTKPPTK